MPIQRHSIESNYEEGEYVEEYPVEGGDGHVKSWKHKKLEIEVAVVKQHKGMGMFHRVYVAKKDEDSIGNLKVSQIGGDCRSKKAALEEAMEWMREHPMAGYENHIRCKECGDYSKFNNEEPFVMCSNCDNSEAIRDKDQAERFEVLGSDGEIHPYEVDA